MNFDRRAVQAHVLDTHSEDLLSLQPRKDPIQDPRFAPPVHPGVDRVPVTEVIGKSSPLAAMFHHIEQGVDELQIAQTHVAALARQAVGDVLELLLG